MTKRIFRKKWKEQQNIKDYLLEGNKFIGIETGVAAGGGAVIGSILGSAIMPGPGSFAGASIGATAGVGIGATFGKISGNILHNLLNRGVKEILSGNYGEREVLRMAGVTYCIYDKVNKNFEDGKMLRGDGFFDFDRYHRTPAEQIIEAVKLVSKEEYREDKIRYLGNLCANILFDQSIRLETAFHLIKISEQLSFNQMAIMAFFSIFDKKHSTTFTLDNTKYTMKNTYIYAYEGIDNCIDFNIFSSELKQMRDYEIFGMQGYPNNDSTVPSSIDLTPIGQSLVKLMELSNFDERYFKKFVNFVAEKVDTNSSSP